MASKTTYTVRFRRKREGKTNYKKRLELLKGRTTRLVVRKSNTQIILQLVDYAPDGDKILLTVQSRELEKNYGWKYSHKNTPAAYLTGLLLAKKAKDKKIENAILDMGLNTPFKGNKLFAALKGAIEGGLKIPASTEIFPADDRLLGKHIAAHSEKYKNITQDFEKIKSELMK